jgi:hypothetical protein
MEYKALLNILNPIRMPPTTLAEDSLNDRHQSCASRIYISPLVLWKKERPCVDLVCSSVDNLQKGRAVCIVKYNVIPAVPHCPNQSTNSNSYLCFGKFVDPIQPISKHIFYISGGRHIESEVNNSPDQSSEFAFKKEVFYGLFLITKGYATVFNGTDNTSHFKNSKIIKMSSNETVVLLEMQRDVT